MECFLLKNSKEMNILLNKKDQELLYRLVEVQFKGMEYKIQLVEFYKN
jgi:hypothetical protein